MEVKLLSLSYAHLVSPPVNRENHHLGNLGEGGSHCLCLGGLRGQCCSPSCSFFGWESLPCILMSLVPCSWLTAVGRPTHLPPGTTQQIQTSCCSLLLPRLLVIPPLPSGIPVRLRLTLGYFGSLLCDPFLPHFQQPVTLPHVPKALCTCPSETPATSYGCDLFT